MTTIQARLVSVRYRPSGFDYMRIALATGVIWLHSVEVTEGLNATLALWAGWARPFIGVILPMFFALSGFLVAGSLERNKSIVSFLGLRVIRLMPALAVEITLSAIILGPLFTTLPLRDYFGSSLFQHYFLNIIGDIHYVLPGVFSANPLPGTVNSQLWTIPFELKCYGILTVIACLGLFGARRLLLASMVLLQLAVAARMLVHHSPYVPFIRGILLVGCFLAGITLYRWRDRLPWSRNLAIASGIVTAVLMWLPPYGDFFISFPSAYLTVYLGLLNPRRNRLLLSGDYSYGMYLYGYPIQQAFTALGAWTHSWWLNLAVTWPLAFALAAFSWWFVEKPAMWFKKPLTSLENNALKFKPFRSYSSLVFMTGEKTKPA